MSDNGTGGKKYTATTTDASAVNQELTDSLPEDAVLRRDGEDCTFFYRKQNGTLVERAMFDDGHVGAVYQAGGDIDPTSDDVDVLEADAWPTREDDFGTGAPVLMTDGGRDMVACDARIHNDQQGGDGEGRSVYEVLLAVVDELGERTAAGAPVGDVIEETLSRVSVGLSQVAEGIQDLLRKGEIYQPDETTVRRVGGDA